MNSPLPGQADFPSLSPRELDILGRIVNGMTNHEIASELNLAMSSVKTHVRSAYRKIGVVSRVQAVIWGARNGLLVHDLSGGDGRHP